MPIGSAKPQIKTMAAIKTTMVNAERIADHLAYGTVVLHRHAKIAWSINPIHFIY